MKWYEKNIIQSVSLASIVILLLSWLIMSINGIGENIFVAPVTTKIGFSFFVIATLIVWSWGLRKKNINLFWLVICLPFILLYGIFILFVLAS
jgi:hypothetical protein